VKDGIQRGDPAHDGRRMADGGLPDIAIRLLAVSKCYRLYRRPQDRLREFLSGGRRVYHTPFWALRDVTLDVPRGASVGLLGRNGAGKSTLLGIVAGLVQPTAGGVDVRGRVSAILELGTGFNPDLTGRENLRIGGAVQGIAPEELEARLEAIIAFAELGDFIDQPVRTYSTGMYVRLAFAAAIQIEPEVLVVDEALAVGDIYFQRKSLDRIERFRQRGRTLVFVSHDARLIRRVCDRAVWLERGKVMAEGDVEAVVPEYESFCLSQDGTALGQPAPGTAPAPADPARAELREKVARDLRLVGTRWSVGNQRIRITQARLLGADGRERWHFRRGERVVVELDYTADEAYPRAVFAVDIHRADGVFVCSFNNYDIAPCALPVAPGPGRLRVRIPALDLPGGRYALSFKAYTEPDDPFWTDPADIHSETIRFLVAAPRIQHGLLVLPAVWEQVR
jgi:ABC-type polysaccharide/polyol phosphate transport system ATPase subunit